MLTPAKERETSPKEGLKLVWGYINCFKKYLLGDIIYLIFRKQEEPPHPSGAPLNQGSKVVLDTTRKILPLLRGGAHRAEG